MSTMSVSPTRVAGSTRSLVAAALLLILVAVLAGLGQWQLRRAHEKEALEARLAEARAHPQRALPGLRPLPGQMLRLDGPWDAAHAFLLDNRTWQGRPGYWVMLPMQLPDGRWMLVARGWLPAGADRSTLPALPPPPAGSISGEVRYPAAHPYTLADTPGAGGLWQVLDLAALRKATGLDLVDFMLLQTSATPDGLVRDWPPAEGIGPARHRAYALQWFGLSAVTLGGGLAILLRGRR